MTSKSFFNAKYFIRRLNRFISVPVIYVLMTITGFTQLFEIVGLDSVYCITDPIDTVLAIKPETQFFGGDGITQISDDPVTKNSRAIFDLLLQVWEHTSSPIISGRGRSG